MSDFEFIFALFGLLLGLSLIEVIGGFARTIEARLRPGSVIRIGWLTPLLGAFVVLDLLSFWQAAWVVRDLVAVSLKSLTAITAFASAYYLAANLVFPTDITEQRDLDTHFFWVRRVVIGILIGLLACQFAWYLSIPAMAAKIVNPLTLSLTAILLALMVAAMFTKGERWSRFAMLALVGRDVVLWLWW